MEIKLIKSHKLVNKVLPIDTVISVTDGNGLALIKEKIAVDVTKAQAIQTAKAFKDEADLQEKDEAKKIKKEAKLRAEGEIEAVLEVESNRKQPKVENTSISNKKK